VYEGSEVNGHVHISTPLSLLSSLPPSLPHLQQRIEQAQRLALMLPLSQIRRRAFPPSLLLVFPPSLPCAGGRRGRHHWVGGGGGGCSLPVSEEGREGGRER